MLTIAGNAPFAIQNLRNAIELSPRDSLRAVWFSSLSEAYFLLGDLEAVLEWSARAKRLGVGSQRFQTARMAALALTGKEAQAREESAEFLQAHPEMTVTKLTRRHPTLACDEPYRRGLELAGFPP